MLGFHLKVPVAGLDANWTVEQRHDFLLDPSIAEPLSADHAVWADDERPALLHALFHDYWDIENSAPNGLTLHQQVKEQAVAAWPDGPADAVLLGLDFPEPHRALICEDRRIDPTGAGSTALLRRMFFLGYDVCDYWLVSGLTNCGLPSVQRAEMRASFSARLNAHGLFAELNDAMAFATRIDTMIVEHAPFTPVALSMLELAELAA